MALKGSVGRSRHRRAAALLAVAALTAYVGLDIVDVVPGGLTRAQLTPSGPRPATRAGPGTRPSDPSPADPATLPLSTPSPAAPGPNATGVNRVLGSLPRQAALGASVGVDVRDGMSAAVLYRVDAARPRTPASAAKILTAVALATQDGLGAGISTRAVVGGRPDEVVLVAGGDTLLAGGRGRPTAVVGRAGLADLADQVATRLRTAAITRVSVRLDTTTASGPPLAPGWRTADVRAGFTGPVSMIGLSTTRAVAGRPAPADPAAGALRAFQATLRAQGLQVTTPGTAGGGAAAPPGGTATPTSASDPDLRPGTQLGEVVSAPVRDVLALALIESDNALTESLARRAAAAAGSGTSFAAVGGWVRARVEAAGIDVTGVRLADASGLSAESTAPATALSGALLLAASGQQAPLAQVVSQLPVAGLTGTLHDRFLSGTTRAAAGLVRAKTGTLTGVSTLAGTVVDADGRLLVFTVMADRVPAGGTSAARVALDRLVTALAGCGCR